MIRAALHVHSTYSDGELTLPELRAKYIAAGCRAVCMADHADAFDAEKVASYVAEMERLSDDTFLFVPGLEFGCVQRMHVAGYGVTSLTGSDDPQLVIAHIRAHSGVAVIAHPPDQLFPWIEGFGTLPDGIEAWNSKYDGQYAPRPGTFDLIARLQRRAPALRAFYGQDFHWRRQFAALFTEIDVRDVTSSAILDALMRGAYRGSHLQGVVQTVLPSDGVISVELRGRFEETSARTMRVRATLKSVKRTLGGAFKLLPAPVKAYLRRFF